MFDWELQKLLYEHELTIFTRNQIAALLKSSPDTTSVKLNRLEKKGLLKRVIKGKYCLPDSEPVTVATGLFPPSYISMLKAIEYYGCSTQKPLQIDVINTMFSGEISISLNDGDYNVRFIKTVPENMYGFRKEYAGTKIIFVAEPEKAVIDALLFGEFGFIEDIIEIIELKCDSKKLMDYAIKTKKQSVMKRLGFLMEKAGLKVEFKNLSNTWVPLNPKRTRTGKYNKKWRIIDNYF